MTIIESACVSTAAGVNESVTSTVKFEVPGVVGTSLRKQMPATIDLERLYDGHAQALFEFLLNFTRNEADTRDLLQELFVKLAGGPSCLTACVRNGLFCCGWRTIWRST